jgi:DnaJ-class molecular chaperone
MSNTTKCKGCDGIGHLSGDNCPDCDGLGVQVEGDFCTHYAPDNQPQVDCGSDLEHHQQKENAA